MRKVSTIVGIIILLAAAGLRAQSNAAATVAVCLPCHGPDAPPPAPGTPPIPKLDGQHPEYIVKQLREFKAGDRKNDLMAPILKNLGKGQFPALAAHFASQPPAPRPPANAQLAERGRAIYEEGNAAVPACVGCHMPNAVGGPRYPRLAGQRQAYVVQQLTNFKTGARTNDRAHVMRSIAANLSDDDMRAVAEYVAGR